MRILIYSYNYYPEPIGIAPLMTELAEGLVARGHQVRVITAMPNYPERTIYPEYQGHLYKTEERNGVQIQRCFVMTPKKSGLMGRFALELSFITLSFTQALRGWRPDVILNTSPSLPACVPVAVLKAWFRCPSVLSLQDILPEAAIQTGMIKNRLAIRVFEMLESFAYGSATRIGVIASGFRENLLSKGVPDAKMVSISNWVDVDFISPRPTASSQFRQQHQLQDKFVVLYTGNIAETQGINTAIEAAQSLASYPDIQMVIVGEAKKLTRLNDLCQQLGLTNVSLVPFVPREALPDLLAAANVTLILQKRGVVGFNMPSKTQVLLASGRPIIASVPGTGTSAQAIRASGGGIVVEPENPEALAQGILDLYHRPQWRQQLAQQGRRYALDHYSFKRALDRYEDLFYALAKSRRPATEQPTAQNTGAALAFGTGQK